MDIGITKICIEHTIFGESISETDLSGTSIGVLRFGIFINFFTTVAFVRARSTNNCVDWSALSAGFSHSVVKA